MSIFKCKQFEVQQDQAAMKVGTDGMLLGAWAPTPSGQRLLDIGTGTGIMALMLAQRCPEASIDALEIEPAAQQQARQNFARSPWPDRLQLIAKAVQAYEAEQLYDHIISNPPFYAQENFSPASGQQRQWARSTQQLSHRVLLQAAKRLAHPTQGRLSLVLPTGIAQIVIQEAQQQGWQLWRQTAVCPAPGKAPVRLLLYFGLQTQALITNEICIRNDSKVYKDYHKDYQKLLEDFLIIF